MLRKALYCVATMFFCFPLTIGCAPSADEGQEPAPGTTIAQPAPPTTGVTAPQPQ